MKLTPVVIQARDELTRVAYAESRCDALTSDATTLTTPRVLPAGHRLVLACAHGPVAKPS